VDRSENHGDSEPPVIGDGTYLGLKKESLRLMWLKAQVETEDEDF
jgi:hypothetical protein